MQLFDVAATMLDAAGADEAARRAWAPDARSLLPLACGETAEARPTAVGAYRNSGLAAGGYWDPPIHATMLRAGRFKLNVYHLGDDPDAPLEGELYDLEADPDEATNLWDDLGHLATRLGLLERLLAWEAAQERRLGSTGGVRRPEPGQRLHNTV